MGAAVVAMIVSKPILSSFSTSRIPVSACKHKQSTYLSVFNAVQFKGQQGKQFKF
jgi:hypothetical protein